MIIEQDELNGSKAVPFIFVCVSVEADGKQGEGRVYVRKMIREEVKMNYMAKKGRREE